MEEYLQDKFDLLLKNKFPSEIWHLIISYLPRITRQSLAKLQGFRDIVDRK